MVTIPSFITAQVRWAWDILWEFSNYFLSRRLSRRDINNTEEQVFTHRRHRHRPLPMDFNEDLNHGGETLALRQHLNTDPRAARVIRENKKLLEEREMGVGRLRIRKRVVRFDLAPRRKRLLSEEQEREAIEDYLAEERLRNTQWVTMAKLGDFPGYMEMEKERRITEFLEESENPMLAEERRMVLDRFRRSNLESLLPVPGFYVGSLSSRLN